ncbi:MAG TPA: response regulator transcription factor [Bryobacteraceae bacterium]|jgi:DNA-binding NarL/FixJ family response regulator|nr:response regulator transcription factor [Bryobacteraceae bacterium]
MRARLVIAEDYEPTQYILRRLLEPHYDVVAVVGNGRALLEAVEGQHPNIVLLDISMPIMNGMVAAKRLTEAHPEVKILFISSHAERVYIEEACKVGASGYLLKNYVERELLNAIDYILSGGTYGLTESRDQ